MRVIVKAGKHKRVGVSLCLLPRRVLQSMWELLLRMILDAVAENRGVQVEFYNRFQYTVEVSDYWVYVAKHSFSYFPVCLLRGVCLKKTCVRIFTPTVPISL